LVDLIFEVVGRTKAERFHRGKRVVTYRVTLSTTDGRHTLVLTDTDSSIIDLYPFGSAVNVSIGPNPQTNFAKEA
jgi:hypothetical protein